MHRTIKLFLVNIIGLIIVSGCSTTPLRSTRLNKAETYIIQAEQAISAHKMNIATHNMGTAKAYLDTIKDNLKFLTKAEVKRFNLLKVRAKTISSRITF
jgi:hypothetical protein